LVLPQLSLTVGGNLDEAVTSVGVVGSDVLGISTAIGARGFELASCYLHEPAGSVGSSHLEIGPTPSQPPLYRLAPADEVVDASPGWCLFDHAAELREVLARRCRTDVMVEVPMEVLRHLPTRWHFE
jgi:hypothetical protein